mgnify:CR=1 FL=1
MRKKGAKTRENRLKSAENCLFKSRKCDFIAVVVEIALDRAVKLAFIQWFLRGVTNVRPRFAELAICERSCGACLYIRAVCTVIFLTPVRNWSYATCIFLCLRMLRSRPYDYDTEKISIRQGLDFWVFVKMTVSGFEGVLIP